jgi:hypothetical protein
MNDFEDPLDLLNDDGDGVIEMSILEEEEKHKKGGGNNNSGCCIIFLALGSSALLSIWGITKLIT